MTGDKPQDILYENQEWASSLSAVHQNEGVERVRQIVQMLRDQARTLGVGENYNLNTPYLNTIPRDDQPPYPGNREIERRIKSIIRWNAMAMVVRANRLASGIGGHISTYASAATLWEVGFNHFFRAKNRNHDGDIIYFQGHAAPGVYARAFLEGRLEERQLENFRRELAPGGGLPSYPHPRLMPDFWELPTVSMGLSPIMAVYQARFMRYLENRGVKEPSDRKVWVFLGDGEMDEPESLGALSVAGRNQLDNLIFVVNCNLQRLDGPVRGNGKIIQELEAVFAGAGWNVIKVIWGSDFDELLANDHEGLLARRMAEVPDGQFQKYAVSSGDFIRKDFFGKDSRLLKMVEHHSDEQLEKLRRGGHDPVKVYAAYQAACRHRGKPTVMLAQTIKGYGLGEAGEGRNVTHQQKKLNEQELLEFRSKFGIPIPDQDVHDAPFYKPLEQSHEMEYLHQRRQALGGYLPRRQVVQARLQAPDQEMFEEFRQDSGDRQLATTMAMVRILAKLLKDKNLGPHIVPIIPDEARTFGMESLFRQAGIYSPEGQLYEPVDKDSLLYYNEQKQGAILEEGISEAGSMSSFIAAGTADAVYSVPMVPFYFFYSIFGCQRMQDLIWAAGDAMAKGFLIGGISGRTTMPGEGLQHQDGQSHVFELSVPGLKAYDPAFAYELELIVQDGLRRICDEGENLLYYITVINELYPMPAMPEGVEEGVVRGAYRFRKTSKRKSKGKAHLLGSGGILNEALKAKEMLEKQFNVAADVWSVTSWKELYVDAVETSRWNMLHPEEKPRTAYIQQCFTQENDVYVCACDYLKALPLTVADWLPGRTKVLGTDGYGRSEDRSGLRRYFEVDAQFICLATLQALAEQGKITGVKVAEAIAEFGIDPEKTWPYGV